MNAHRTTSAVLVCGLVLAMSGVVAADTTVGGFISTDTQWTAAGGPYIVEDSIAVIGGAKLSIDAGVQVRFQPDMALVVDSGSLVARGTQASPILFTANQGSGNPWGYIQFSDGAVNATFDGGGNYVSGSILEHATVEYAGSLNLYAVRAIDSSPFVHASAVQNNAYGGIYVNGAGANAIRLAENTITSNTGVSGIFVQSTAGAQIADNTITNNPGSYGGVYLDFSSGSALTGNTITNNSSSHSGGGVYLNYSSGSALTGNTITNNTSSGGGGGVALSSSGSSTLTGNIITGNTAGSWGGGVNLYSSSSSTLTDNTITNNTGTYGGGLYLWLSGSAALTGNTIAENTAANQGGAIYARASNNVTFFGDRITENYSDLPDGVGGIFITQGSDGWDLTGSSDPDPVEPFVYIYGNDNYEFYNDNAFGGSFGYDDPGNVDARYVYWGTMDTAAIEAGIFDFFDNASKGVVFYSPSAVPEPATLSLLVLGIGALAFRRQKS